jgi:N-acetyl-gamma-glutamyl-phosphate reductase
MANNPIRIILIGGSGYAGFEVLKWLARHPSAEVVGVFGPESELGPMDQFYPHLTKQVSLRQELFEPEKVAALDVDLAMLCVPHKVAMSYVPALREAGLKVIDWSADYRLKNRDVYEQWYCPHTDADRLSEAVYGLPELFSDEIRSAELIANPGCYPTCAALPLAPAIAAGLIEPEGIVVNAISGVSGAGRKPMLKFHFPERNENFEAYGVGTHRHMPEMEQTLNAVTGKQTDLLFVPHLSPMDRGMLATIYARPTSESVTAEQIAAALHEAYDECPFVRVRDEVLPATKYVINTNFCDVGVRASKGRVILMSALDNLLKGASTQAIQNMNLMFGLDETAGLY